MTEQTDVLVIGGGAIGLCTAYYLNEMGRKVTLIDKGQPGGQCSYGNAGLVVPSHYIPLAAPGMVAKGIKYMFNPEGPFYIRPRLDPELIRWSWNFYRASNKKRMNKAVPVLRDLCLKAQELYIELDKKKDFEFNFKKEGLFVLYNSEHGEADEVRVAEIGNKIGIKAEVKNADEIMAMEPNLKLSARGGVFYPDDAHITPHLFSESMVNYLKKNGVTILDNTEVTSIESNGRAVRRVKTSAGDFKAREYVMTGGSWSVPLLRTAGINLLMQAGKGYSISMKNPDAQLKYPYILNEARVAITPMKGFLRFAGTMEMAGIDLSINQRRVNAIARNVTKYFANFNVADTTSNEIWGGLRPCTPDGMPYIGRFKDVNNLSIVAGHAMVGITLATVSGLLMAEVLNGEKPSVDLDLLKPDRFK